MTDLDPADVELVLAAVKRSDAAHTPDVYMPPWLREHQWVCQCGERSAETNLGTAIFGFAEHCRRMTAEAALTALAEAGRLMPPVVEERIEADLGTAIFTYDEMFERGLTMGDRCKQRTVRVFADESELIGPWRAVEATQ